MAISERLKIARKLLGINQGDAAIGAGLKQKDVSMMESGAKKFIPNEYILFLSDKGIDMNSLFDLRDEVRLIHKYEHIPHNVTSTFNEPDSSKKQLPQSLDTDNSKKIASPTASPTAPDYAPPNAPPTSEYGVNAVYLTPQFITVDRDGEENILHISTKAAAGYLRGFADREYLERQPSFRLPGLSDATYRSFEVDGDSMHPTLKHGQMVIGKWVEKLEYIREDRVYIIVHKTRGVIIKRLLNRIKERNKIVCKSDATDDRQMYKTFEIDPEEIQELWYAVFHGGFDFQSPSDLWKRVNNNEADLVALQGTVDKLLGVIKTAGLLKE
ncbi:S24 family peptidase [Mucilaginibacter sp. L3T2-6]|uniref:S24 family peptidase n=1 Tax=Mucilaginibacter sp. L3T2-6 TaxID=3062491 RepID=UPI0026774316|nr:S24 family peptidase [Mucilaginibacter sp. L3T2-6]MDO3641941.1 S24 family peptidase [Mucilaginibacter sp. L3T2-6]MDV6214381.1 S24 family peptidase [Mucilaginibacter sp. L3T2-6]